MKGACAERSEILGHLVTEKMRETSEVFNLKAANGSYTNRSVITALSTTENDITEIFVAQGK